MGKEEPSLPDLSRWYTDSEVIHEETVSGVPVKIKEISGEDYTALVEKCMNARTGTLDRRKYFEAIVAACVIEPKGITPSKLKPGPLTALVQKIEDVLGLTEVVQKNLLNR